MDWKKGSVVRLKSGGPNMTVQQISDAEIICAWFDNNTAQSANFAAESLVNGDEPRADTTIYFSKSKRAQK